MFKKRLLTMEQSVGRQEVLSTLSHSSLSLPGSGSHLLSQLLVFGLQVLAVATPRSVELDQNVFAVVVDDGVKVLRHQHLQTGEAGREASAGFGRSRSGVRVAISP